MDTLTDTVPVTWKIILQLWWSFVWRYLVVTVLAGMYFSLPLLWLFATKGEPIETISESHNYNLAVEILFYISSIPISIYVLKRLLEMNHHGFSIVLIRKDVKTPDSPKDLEVNASD